MKTVEETIVRFEEKFNAAYVSMWKSALKHDKRQELFIYLTKDNDLIFRRQKSTINDMVAHIYFSPIDFMHVQITSDDIIKHLTDDDKIQYFKRQLEFVENDDYLFYSLKEHMLEWLKTYAGYALEKCIEEKIVDRRTSFKKSQSFADIMKCLESMAAQNLNKTSKVPSKLKVEYDELVDKIQRLVSFIEYSTTFKTLSEKEQSAMKEQLIGMNKYATALETRLELIKNRGDKDASSI